MAGAEGGSNVWKFRGRLPSGRDSDSDSSSGASTCSGMIEDDTDAISVNSGSIPSSVEGSPEPTSRLKLTSSLTTELDEDAEPEGKKSVPNENEKYNMMRKITAGTLKHKFGISLDQDVRTYKDVAARRIMYYRVRRVVNPFEFYMEFINVPPSRVYANWFYEMQVFYQDQKNQEKLKVFKGIPLVGRCYVCKDPNDQRWHRVRVYQINNNDSHRTFVVYYLDLCKLQETMSQYLLELEPKFAESPAQVLRCYLHDIRPNVMRSMMTWSSAACRYFREAVEGKEFTGIVLTRSDDLVSQGMPDIISTVGIVLVENIPGTRQPNPDACTLNASMVDAKHAVATGVCASCKHSLQVEGCDPSFDQAEFNRLYPLLPPEKEPAMPSMQQQKVEDKPAAVNQFPEHIWSQLQTPTGQSLEDAEKEGAIAFYRNTTVDLPVEIACRLARIDIVFVSSPSCIIVHLKSKQEQLKVMQRSMGRLAATDEYLLDGKPGTFVACCILERNTVKEENSIWCRGIIKSVHKAETLFYRILLIDFGNEVTVESVFVHRLPPYFEKIPSFAIRLHLEPSDFQPAGSASWSVAAGIEFRRYTSSWANKEPNYFCYRPTSANPLELSYFTQQIIYDSRNAYWYPVKARKSSCYKVVDLQRKNSTLRSLYFSFGADILYEILAPNSHFWHFETVADTLLKGKYALKLKTRKTSTRHHMEMLETATTFHIDKSPITSHSM